MQVLPTEFLHLPLGCLHHDLCHMLSVAADTNIVHISGSIRQVCWNSLLRYFDVIKPSSSGVQHQRALQILTLRTVRGLLLGKKCTWSQMMRGQRVAARLQRGTCWQKCQTIRGSSHQSPRPASNSSLSGSTCWKESRFARSQKSPWLRFAFCHMQGA